IETVVNTMMEATVTNEVRKTCRTGALACVLVSTAPPRAAVPQASTAHTVTGRGVQPRPGLLTVIDATHSGVVSSFRCRMLSRPCKWLGVAIPTSLELAFGQTCGSSLDRVAM